LIRTRFSADFPWGGQQSAPKSMPFCTGTLAPEDAEACGFVTIGQAAPRSCRSDKIGILSPRLSPVAQDSDHAHALADQYSLI
jgi:hypothetical protein